MIAQTYRVNVVMIQGSNTALHWAAMRGYVEICKLLMDSGADKNRANQQSALPIDNCQPQWSSAYKYTQQILAAY
jgi:ankyrin repeat protein